MRPVQLGVLSTAAACRCQNSAVLRQKLRALFPTSKSGSCTCFRPRRPGMAKKPLQQPQPTARACVRVNEQQTPMLLTHHSAGMETAPGSLLRHTATTQREEGVHVVCMCMCLQQTHACLQQHINTPHTRQPLGAPCMHACRCHHPSRTQLPTTCGLERERALEQPTDTRLCCCNLSDAALACCSVLPCCKQHTAHPPTAHPPAPICTPHPP